MVRYLSAGAMCVLLIATSCNAYALDGMGIVGGPDMPGMASMSRPPMNGSCPTPEFYMANADELGLSREQLSELRKMDFSLKRQQIVMGAGVRALELELTEIVTDPGFDKDAALGKLAEIEKARTQLRSEVIKASAKARDLLDADQKAGLGELLSGAPAGRPGLMRKPHPRRDRKSMKPDMKNGIKEDMKQRMMQEMMQENMP